MNQKIEDYALLSDLHTTALVGKNGSIDWLCVPCVDSPACFAALLGTKANGLWRICPRNQEFNVSRQYREDTLILETEFQTSDGIVRLIDFMPVGQERNRSRVDIIRQVEGVSGKVEMEMEIIFRFDYGQIIPWVQNKADGLYAIAGPDAIRLCSPTALVGQDFTTQSRFTVGAGEKLPFSLTWYQPTESVPPYFDPMRAEEETDQWWHSWIRSSTLRSDAGEYQQAVTRSLITLKALTYEPSGGIVAAPTTSLPENLGGSRNWDYRYCWIRDATFALYALLTSGYMEEARAWQQWLLRVCAGEPSKLQTVYSVIGRRRLTEEELPWLCGYENSKPVRVGNAAYIQNQLDVYGELMDSLHVSRKHGMILDENAWALQTALMNYLEDKWTLPGEGIWEIRGPPRHFTHSKVMAWVAFDRAIKACQTWGLPGPVTRWKEIRDQIHRQVCTQGFSEKRNAFIQSYGSNELDAALLLLPLVGFLPTTDARIVATVDAIYKELTTNGLVRRYETSSGVDGLSTGEGTFIACTFWLADCLALIGRKDEAREIFEQLLSIRNDVGLLAEEYDTVSKRQLGNFPQAFSHVAIINTANNLSSRMKPATHRSVT